MLQVSAYEDGRLVKALLLSTVLRHWLVYSSFPIHSVSQDHHSIQQWPADEPHPSKVAKQLTVAEVCQENENVQDHQSHQYGYQEQCWTHVYLED